MQDQELFKNLESVLKRGNLTQAWAARKLNISPTYLNRVVKGASPLTDDLKNEMKDLISKIESSGLAEAM